jgi:hypothetical protein
MALVTKLTPITLEKDSHHTDVECTYSIVEGADRRKYLQIDTYGSSTRAIPGKKSQSIRFSPEAIAQLKELLANQW